MYLRNLILVIPFFFISETTLSQVFNCEVQVIAPTLQNNPANEEIFTSLRNAMVEYINFGYSWTNDKFEQHEQIDVSFLLTINSKSGNDFNGQLQITSQRPIFNSDYKSLLMNYIDKNVSFADLKQTLLYFTKALFGKSKIRLRPSYFPFTEPSAEVDIYWGLETETDYRITKGTGWLEIMGCGIVDPNVLKNCKIDPDEYSGYAFGMGIERIAMLLYQIEDIRLFFENDVRFLSQFQSGN